MITYKHVLHLGGKGGDIVSESPILFHDSFGDIKTNCVASKRSLESIRSKRFNYPEVFFVANKNGQENYRPVFDLYKELHEANEVLFVMNLTVLGVSGYLIPVEAPNEPIGGSIKLFRLGIERIELETADEPPLKKRIVDENEVSEIDVSADIITMQVAEAVAVSSSSSNGLETVAQSVLCDQPSIELPKAAVVEDDVDLFSDDENEDKDDYPDLVVSAGLTIFSNQQRTAIDLYRKVRDLIRLRSNKVLNKVNYVFIGPASIEIKEQTQNDLKDFLNKFSEISGCPGASIQVITAITENSVLGSNDLKDSDKLSFVKQLKDDPFDTLHVIIHDEAHWGLKKGSKITTFFESVMKLVEDVEGVHTLLKVPLVMIPVSATSAIFVDNQDIVKELKLSTVELNPGPGYITIDELLNAAHFDSSQIAQAKNQKDRAPLVAQEYLIVIQAWLKFLRNPSTEVVAAFNTAKKSFPSTFHALAESIMKDVDAAEALVNEGNFPPDLPRNKTLFIRLSSVIVADQFTRNILQVFEEERCKPFEVVSFSAATASFVDQLQRHRTADPKLQNLINFPLMIIAVDRFQMGARIPSNCAIYDVRNRYQKSPDLTITSTASLFIQDIGRCCGYNKLVAQILFAFKYRTQDGAEDFRIKTQHCLMNANHTSKSDFDYEFYIKVLKRSIILCAAPQVGKTGTFLAFLREVLQRHSADTSAIKPSDFALRLDKITKTLSRIATTEGFTALRDMLKEKNMFQKYHHLIDVQRSRRVLIDTNEMVMKEIEKETIENGLTSVSVADMGCGLHGLHDYVLRNVQRFPSDVSVDAAELKIYGVDLHPSIAESYLTFQIERCYFNPIVKDMAKVNVNDFDGIPVDVVVFNLSLFDNNSIVANLKTAYEISKPGALLMIIDVSKRFTQLFSKKLRLMGWPLTGEELLQVGSFDIYYRRKDAKGFVEPDTFEEMKAYHEV